MTAHLPYKILHIHLDKNLAIPALPDANQGNYLIFWYNEFALGQLFLEPGQQLTEAEFLQELMKVIAPALEFYEANYAGAKQDWQQYLSNSESKKFRKYLDQIFLSYKPIETPKQVPVSVIICTRNRSEQLLRCLENMLQLTTQPEEIIVVDNAPSDNSTREVVEKFKEVRYVKEPKPGLDIARNTGVKNSSSPIIAYADDDVVLHPNWLFRVWESFKDPEVAAITGLVIAAELETEAQYLFEKYWSFNRGFSDKIFGPEFFHSTLKKGPPVWKIGAGANMAFRKSVVEEVGYFDELLDAGAAGCNGDSEMWYRILAKGYTIQYNPRAIVFHEHRKELDALKKQIFNYMRGHAAAALIQHKQHKNAGYKKHLTYMFLVTYSQHILKGFPEYRAQYKTIWVQIAGLVSGIAYYYKNQKKTKSILN